MPPLCVGAVAENNLQLNQQKPKLWIIFEMSALAVCWCVWPCTDMLLAVFAHIAVLVHLVLVLGSFRAVCAAC